MAAMDCTLELTPSEVELLRASAGTQIVLFGNLTRKLTDEGYLSLPVLERIFIKALEANQAAGNLVCQVQNGRSLFGINHGRQVVIRANGGQYAWPVPSLEATIASLVRSLSSGTEMVTITELVHAWFRESTIRHLQASLRWVYDALADRGWVRRGLEQRLELFGIPYYEIPGGTRRLVEEYRWDPDSPDDLVPEAKVLTNDIIERALHKELRKLFFRCQ